MTAAEKKKAAESIRDNFTKKMLTEQLRATLPEASLLEDALAGALSAVEKDGVTTVLLNGRGNCRVHQAKEGPRKGQWLIYLIEE